MKIHAIIAAGAVSLAGLALAAGAGPGGPNGNCSGRGRGPRAGLAGPAGARVYDPDTVTTVRGAVSEVTVVPARRGPGGLHVVLQAEGKSTEVHLGPTWYVQEQGLELAKGDALEVQGSLVEQDGRTFLVAREVQKGAKVLTLRDELGVPAWAGQGRRGRP